MGPALHAVAVYPEPEAGVDCGVGSPDDCGVPGDVVLQIRFDRYLLPETAVRQSIHVYTGDPSLGVFLQPEYDMVERVLSFHGAFLPGVLYSVELVVPTDEGSFGFRAFDGAPLGEGPVPLKFDFRTAKAEPPAPPEGEAPVSCELALAALAAQNGGCASAACHSSEGSPPMGLVLDSAAGIVATAIDRPAHETEIGGKSGVVLESPARLGVSMPIIEPGRPDNSYLMYKLLRKTDSFRTTSEPATVCVTNHQVGFGPDGLCPPPPPKENSRLREWFVRGEPMPLGITLDAEHPRDRMLLLQRWIREGAHLDGCL